MHLTVEDALHRIEGRTALLIFAAYAAMETQTIADSEVYGGLADALDDIRVLVQQVRAALGMKALMVEIAPPAD